MVDVSEKKAPRTVAEWLRAEEHLPYFLKDFHDQKVVFRELEEWGRNPSRPALYEVPAVCAQLYVMDVLLPWLAHHGYTVQRTRARLPFYNLSDTLRASRERFSARFARIFDKAAARKVSSSHAGSASNSDLPT